MLFIREEKENKERPAANSRGCLITDTPLAIEP